MEKHLLLIFLLMSLLACYPKTDPAGAAGNAPNLEQQPDSHAKPIVSHILQTRDAVRATCPDCLFITVWDFDGTILKGDCTEGLTENGQEVYPGLAKMAILKGLSLRYKGESGYERFLQEYRSREEKNPLDAYTFILKIFAGARQQDIEDLALSEFNHRYQHYYYTSSRSILRQLDQQGIQTVIISASADLFTKMAQSTLPVKNPAIYGIRQEIRNGVLTDKILEPVTYAEGKTEQLRNHIKKVAQATGRPVVVLAGFGNSYHTDAPFLKFIADQKLPAGKPIAVMINGGSVPEEYKNLFWRVKQDRHGHT